MSNYVKKVKKSFTRACDYAVAMATLKVVDTNIKISARDEWTAPESVNIME